MRTKSEAKGTGGGQKALCFSTSGWPPTAEAPVGWSCSVSLKLLPVPSVAYRSLDIQGPEEWLMVTGSGLPKHILLDVLKALEPTRVAS